MYGPCTPNDTVEPVDFPRRGHRARIAPQSPVTGAHTRRAVHIPSQRTGPTPRPSTAPQWTPALIARHRAKVARSLAWLAAYRYAAADTADVQARLDTALANIARLRARADIGAELARHQVEARHCAALLLADDDHAEMPTEPRGMRVAS